MKRKNSWSTDHDSQIMKSPPERSLDKDDSNSADPSWECPHEHSYNKSKKREMIRPRPTPQKKITKSLDECTSQNIPCQNLENQQTFEEEKSDKEELLMQKLDEIGNSSRNKHKTFEGIPKQWH